jgi:hypothetical protein
MMIMIIMMMMINDGDIYSQKNDNMENDFINIYIPVLIDRVSPVSTSM